MKVMGNTSIINDQESPEMHIYIPRGPDIDLSMAVGSGTATTGATNIVGRGTGESIAGSVYGEIIAGSVYDEIIAERDRGRIAPEMTVKSTETVVTLTATVIAPLHLPVALSTESAAHQKAVRTRIKKKASKCRYPMPHL
jgi:hypothetical protein